MAKIISAMQNYIQETRSEAKKVTWPTRTEVFNNTRVILWVVFLLGIYVAVVDLVMAQGFSFLRRGY
jgi:preprotein translocase subunit SecE